MVHADSSTFTANVPKTEAYEQVLLQAEGLFLDQRNWVWYDTPGYGPFDDRKTTHTTHSNLANTASLLWHAYKAMPKPSNSVNWAGFYVLDPMSQTSSKQQQQLILGPFQGKVACQTIALGRGVCGTAAEKQTTQLVQDVDQFPGHIACDSESRSEIVVPIVADIGGSKRLCGIIDIDCAVVGGFDEVDKANLEKLADLLGRSCDW